VWPFRFAQSSTPNTRGALPVLAVPVNGSPAARTRRSSVIRLVPARSRVARRAPGRPPSAKPRHSCSSRKQCVCRPYTGTNRGRRSQKIRRGHASCWQRKRRELTCSATGAVPQERSAIVRAYRLWTSADDSPQRGHDALGRTVVTCTAIPSSLTTTSSRRNPAPCGTQAGSSWPAPCSGDEWTTGDAGNGRGTAILRPLVYRFNASQHRPLYAPENLCIARCLRLPTRR